MRILFAATGDIAIKTLTSLHSLGLVSAVLTAPDARGKRGKSLIPSPIKQKAIELGLKVYTPSYLGKDFRDEIVGSDFDTLVSFCYGKIFGPKFLAMFKNKFNIHPSLLPIYRGPSPLFLTLLNQDKSLAISIQDIALGMDEGDIYLSKSFDLNGDETTDSISDLTQDLAAVMAQDFFSHDIKPAVKQIGTPSYSTFITKEHGILDFSKSAKELHAQIRACYSWPKCKCILDSNDLYLCKVSGSVFNIIEEECKEECGTICAFDKEKGFKIATSCGYLYVTTVLQPTKKEVDAFSFYNGHKDIIGKVLS